MNTIIRYLYRDASNYKVFNTCVIKGQLSVKQAGTIIDSLDMSEYFIPEQVGIPVTRFGSITEDDHPWCELDAEFYEMTEAEADVNITVDQLTSNFAAAKGKWDAEKYSMITKELLLAAYKNGVVRLIKDPNGAGTVCAIGDFWFYFGGMTAEEYEPEEFIRNVPEETIIQEISETLNWFRTELPVEYFYYREFLKEWSERFDAEYRKDENRCSIKEARGGSICDLQSFSDEDLLSEISRRGIPMRCILEKSGYLAWKLWCREDIESVLESEGYSVTDDNVDEVINTGALSNLEDCTEGEWEIIFEAIRMCSSYLERRQTDD